MSLQYFTLIHILISLVGNAAGFGVISGLMVSKLFSKWTAVFLLTTLATSVTGFFFPFQGITPGIVLGIISVIALAVAIYAVYFRRLEGPWRKAFVFASILSLYLNVFVLVVQLFQKIPALKELAPAQTEPPFAITHAFILVIFICLATNAVKKFR